MSLAERGKVGEDNPAYFGKQLSKVRHLVENCFAKLKQYRAIATGYDKRAETFLCATYMATAVIWLN
ncbi:transposase [Leptolyngbya sp. NK1-12]|uniref:transposase n=1 Tax=Leptolyngbya sp. NK1-12 TaxID=2547451 RepID=UPI003B6419E2